MYMYYVCFVNFLFFCTRGTCIYVRTCTCIHMMICVCLREVTILIHLHVHVCTCIYACIIIHYNHNTCTCTCTYVPEHGCLLQFQSQEIVPDELMDLYLSMTDPTKAQTIDSDLPYYCAFSLPGVLLTLGKENWSILKPTFDALCADMQVRRGKEEGGRGRGGRGEGRGGRGEGGEGGRKGGGRDKVWWLVVHVHVYTSWCSCENVLQIW